MNDRLKEQHFQQQPNPGSTQDLWSLARTSSPKVKARYCYWSVSDGDYGAMMEYCVHTARSAGVFKEFHILTDRPLEGCECYDAYETDKSLGLFKLHYLKVGMSCLNFDYFVWIDGDTVFTRNPIDVLAPLEGSPLHVPLEENLSGSNGDTLWRGLRVQQICKVMRDEGVPNPVYSCGSSFWIIHHDAIEEVYDLAMGFWHRAKHADLTVDVSAALGFAMQILCADPEAHVLSRHPELWASDDKGQFRDSLPDVTAWSHGNPLGLESAGVCPAILHLPHSKHLLRTDRAT